MKAIIMAGGEGSRLRPLTCTRPKPMVPVVNRPCMEHIVNLLRQQGIREIGVTLQYLPEEIRDYFGDGRRFGVDLRYFTEDIPLGTAGSVRNAGSFLDETFVVISGDAVTDCSLQEAAEFHRRKGALVTIVLAEVTCPLEYGVVITTKDGRITRFLEKPGWGEVFSDRVNTGIYILEPEVLEYIEAGQEVDFSRDVFPRLLSLGKEMHAVVLDGRYWCDIGAVEQYVQAHLDILEGRVGLSIPGTESSPGVWLGERVEVDRTACLAPPVVIGDGCTVGPRAVIGPGAVLGRDVRVAGGTSVKRSVVWDGALVDEAAELRGVVVGSRSRVKAGASCFEGAVVGDRSVVGERCLVRPGVKIWPEKRIPGGTRLGSSLVWGQTVRPRLFGSRGITGDLITEISPEMASRLGAAAGSVMGGRISICTDGRPASQMTRHAALSGILATGAGVVDFGSLILPAHRYGIRALRLAGGIHVCQRGLEEIELRLFNGQGVDLSRGEQRRLESVLNREEYRYVDCGRVAGAGYCPEIDRAYLNYLLGFVDRRAARRARLAVVVSYDPERLGRLLPPLLEALGCETDACEPGRPDRQRAPAPSEMLDTAGRLGARVRERGAHLGAVIDSGGEELLLVDEQGQLTQEDRLLSLLALTILDANRAAAPEPPVTLALPVTMPEAVAEHVRRQGGSVIRTKAAAWAQMQAVLEDGVVRSQRRLPQFFCCGDALAALGMIIELLARERRPLSRLIEELPGFASARREVEVAWDDKGKVLRRLAEEAGDAQAEMPEGIRLRHPEGWALVLPDADKPLCRVVAESFNQETAESLTEMYVRKIREICGGGPGEQG
jgi:mannose-1-phosphate guanylyltransferase/phosphomannomutase